MFAYIALLLGIIAESTATLALKESQGFTRLGPLLVVVCGYGFAIACLGSAQKGLPMSLISSVWSGLGITVVTAVAAFRYQQLPSLAALGGIALIIVGIVIVNVFPASHGT
ncbi:multidrug DMT transporter permease [Robbsia andropogonis]|uniref:Multidrug DMT transporter permease n=1 Tax=Robbsia andropogonis TaxID=28092 RepID=A0A0F5JUK9_9BURK|nr:SMR family transporter [Robbsia andropogonis]KKB61355.1 multidrug DMT transporter permease [Robbsia andropogonis]MCP1120852.1 SMR family transporter [Robbsia andropogonis]MCP1130686.1 SMR family transporter [Robbsia andropogonis]